MYFILLTLGASVCRFSMINFMKLMKPSGIPIASSMLRFTVQQLRVQPKPHSSPTIIKSLFSTAPILRHSEDPSLPPGHIPVHFVLKDGSVIETLGRDGEIALRLAQRYDVPMEGACEASLACTTCHCYVEQDDMFDMEGITKSANNKDKISDTLFVKFFLSNIIWG